MTVCRARLLALLCFARRLTQCVPHLSSVPLPPTSLSLSLSLFFFLISNSCTDDSLLCEVGEVTLINQILRMEIRLNAKDLININLNSTL